MRYFIKRTLAYLIDCTIAFASIMLILQWLILTPVRPLVGITEEWFQVSMNMQLYVLLTISIPVWLYFAYFDSDKSKGTFGKRIMKLKLINNTKGRLNLRKSFGRTILKLLPWEIAHIGVIFPTPIYFENDPGIRILTIVGLILFIIYAVSILLDSEKRSLYDKAIGSRVILKNSIN